MLVLLIGVVAVGAGVAVSSFDLPGIGLLAFVVVAALGLGWSMTRGSGRDDDGGVGLASVVRAADVAKPQAAQVLNYATMEPKGTRLPFWAQILIGFIYVIVAGFLTLGLIPSEGVGFGIGLMITAGPAALLLRGNARGISIGIIIAVILALAPLVIGSFFLHPVSRH
ncbi:MAG TPA: hypothetical protein VH370_22520 [Humisphaera sp.]|nr:hypothetical protein [Humisphaera sp.]